MLKNIATRPTLSCKLEKSIGPIELIYDDDDDDAVNGEKTVAIMTRIRTFPYSKCFLERQQDPFYC